METRYKRAIDTPLLAGQDARGDRWLAAAYPILDLFRDPTRGIHVSKADTNILDRTPFVEVYSTHGGTQCCIVDIFIEREILKHPEHMTFPDTGLGRNIYMAANKLEYEWGVEWQGYMPAEQERYARWSAKPLHELIRKGTSLAHFRFQAQPEVDYEELPLMLQSRPGGNWSEHAISWLRYAVNFLIYSRDQPSAKFSHFEIIDMGDQPFYDVANYFVYRGDQ